MTIGMAQSASSSLEVSDRKEDRYRDAPFPVGQIFFKYALDVECPCVRVSWHPRQFQRGAIGEKLLLI